MLQGSRRYSVSLVGYSRLFSKKESCLKKKKMPRIPVNASENQASYSCCQLIQARLATHQSARPRPRQPLTCLPFQHKMETVPKVPIKISICDVCAEKKKKTERKKVPGFFDSVGENTTKAAKILWTSHILKSFLSTQTK